MKEKDLIAKAKEYLTRNGGVAWSGIRNKDIFGIFDIAHLREDGTVTFHQITTKEHMPDRRWKIEKFEEDNRVRCPACSIMGWDYGANDWVIEDYYA
jgi:hypothetical protein